MIATMNSRNNISIPRTRDHGEEELVLRTDKLQPQNHADISCNKGSASIREIGSNNNDSVSSDTGSLDSSKNSKQSMKSSHYKKSKTTKKKNKFWKKPRDKPKRPLSSYNIFFKHTRSRIISGLSDDEGTTPEEVTKAAIEAIVANSTQPRVPRSNRKTHGQIGFGDLAREIANRWKLLDTETRAIYDHYASLDMKRYRSEIAQWKTKMENQAIAESERSNRGDRLGENQANQNESIEWTRVQPRSLETSFDSSASEETNYSSSTEASLQRNSMNSTRFPSHFAIPSHYSSNYAVDALPPFCPTEMTTSPNHEANMKKLQLMEDIINHRKEILVREKHLCAMKASFEQQYSTFAQGASSFPTGPSIERMQQLHLHRMIKGDHLPMRRRMSVNNSRKGDYLPIVDNACEITSDSIHTITSKITDGGMDIDPVPLTDVFPPDFY